MNRDHAGNVNLVSDKIIQVQGLVTVMAEFKQDRLAAPQTLGQGQSEVARRIGLGGSASQCIGGYDLDIRQGQLPIGVAVLP
jgi:hypothetical protein